MVKLYLAYDNTDTELGTFFVECANVVKDVINSADYNFVIEEITPGGGDVSKIAYFSKSIQHDMENPFILVAFMHGNENSFVLDGCEFITINTDNQALKKTYIYTIACSTAVSLGPALIRAGAYSYIGPDRDILMVNKHHGYFANCYTYALSQFLCGTASSHDSFRERRSNHLKQVDDLRKVDRLAASFLRNTLEPFVYLGQSKRIEDFHISD